MAFDSLSEKLQSVFKKLRNKGKINEADVKEAMREVRLALLEADVNYKVVKDFVAAVTAKAVGSEVLESLSGAQHVIKLVHEQLIEVLGTAENKIAFASKPPTIIMMTGLQGAGKTTTTAKLGGILKKQGKRPLLVACDIYRAAAIKQLEVVGSQLDLPVFSMGDKVNPVEIAKAAVAHAEKHANDVVILDTAGRLHINEELMDELLNIKNTVHPHEILLVVDAMTGQDAVSVATSFHEKLTIGGVILTKFDGDTRGGAALSVRSVTGSPIKFIGVGEKLTDLEPFHPDRIASRILGMGDVLTLIEKAEQAFDEKKAAELEKKIRTQSFDLNDFLDQLEQMKNMGPIQNILGMIPGINAKALRNVEVDEKRMSHIEAIIKSMTRRERENPSVLNYSRKQRIAKGSGTQPHEINALLKQFDQMRVMMKQFGDMGKVKHGKQKFKMPFFK